MLLVSVYPFIGSTKKYPCQNKDIILAAVASVFACDAEQIIYCEMDKDNYQIKYSSGSIENPIMRKHVVDVLEGTMPAFELRRKKYFEKLEHSIN